MLKVNAITLVIPLAWSCTQPTILVRWAGPQTGQGPQAAALHLGGQGAVPHRLRRAGGELPEQCAGDTSLSLSPTSTHLYLPICRPPPQVRVHCVNDTTFQINFLSPITLLSIWYWLSAEENSGCLAKDGSDLSKALVCDSAWWRWCRAVWWCTFVFGMSFEVSSGGESVRYSYFMFGFGCVYNTYRKKEY